MREFIMHFCCPSSVVRVRMYVWMCMCAAREMKRNLAVLTKNSPNHASIERNSVFANTGGFADDDWIGTCSKFSVFHIFSRSLWNIYMYSLLPHRCIASLHLDHFAYRKRRSNCVECQFIFCYRSIKARNYKYFFFFSSLYSKLNELTIVGFASVVVPFSVFAPIVSYCSFYTPKHWSKQIRLIFFHDTSFKMSFFFSVTTVTTRSIMENV